MTDKMRVVVVGNGMVGHKFIEAAVASGHGGIHVLLAGQAADLDACADRRQGHGSQS